MKHHFYSHLIEIDTIHDELGKLDLEKHEHDELVTIVHTTIHHTIIDTVLSELSEEDKKVFLQHLSDENHEGLWEHVKGKIENVEEKIVSTVQTLIKELHSDILQTKD